jgi:hypothetical protein
LSKRQGGTSSAILDLLQTGFLAGVPVALAISILATARRNTLRTLLKGVPLIETAAGIWGFGLVIGIFLGVLAAWAYDFVSRSWGWGPTAFLAAGVGVAVLLSIFAYLPFYDGKRMEVALEISILNFVVLVGFGLLVPLFAA